jgi:hypothetical protein
MINKLSAGFYEKGNYNAETKSITSENDLLK